MADVYIHNWMDFLEIATMWAKDYTKEIMYGEIGGGSNMNIDRWCRKLQDVVGAEMATPGRIQTGGL